jgi:hypothetical protein
LSLSIKKNAGGALSSAAKLATGPYDVGGEQTEIAVNTGPGPGTTLVDLSGKSRAWILLRNTSPGAQQIRVGVGMEPSFTAPVAGWLLKPGEEMQIPDCRLLVMGRADIAGALCSRFVMRSSTLV